MIKKTKNLFNSLNIYDFAIIIMIVVSFDIFVLISNKMTEPFKLNNINNISLDISMLPEYGFRTIFRMFVSLLVSIIFTFLIAPIAAKNTYFEKIIIPFIDIMESIPILGFLAVSTITFMNFFPNNILGPELAAIFVIFTSQVWNMILSLYQSLRNIPKELEEVSKVFLLSKWKKFWYIEIPYALPNLIWNIMISMSASWFFIVYSEAISIANQDILLPGIGSYISKAISQANVYAVSCAMLVMFIIILLYDQILCKPILAWSEKFKLKKNSVYKKEKSWFYNFLVKSNIFKLFKYSIILFKNNTYKVNFFFKNINGAFYFVEKKKYKKILIHLFNLISYYLIAKVSWYIIKFLIKNIEIHELLYVLKLGFFTSCKVFILIVISSIIWVPIGVFIGLSSRKNLFQPLIQVIAAFPANLFYPIAIIIITYYDLNTEISTIPLMIFGTQWYILFNIISGVNSINNDIHLIGSSMFLRGFLWWKKIILPSIFPFYVTGSIAAAGGCWNASIAAEVLSWGNLKIISTGIGSYIKIATIVGDFPRLMLGIVVMSFYVIIINKIIWQRLYKFSKNKYHYE